jgi:hypothetical protein
VRPVIVFLAVLLCGAAPGRGYVKNGEILPTTAAWYGDSISQGACNATPPPARLQQQLPGWLVVNRGVSGENVAQITARYFAGRDTDCLGQPCGTYVLAGMTNDCGQGACTPQTVLTTMLTAVDDALSRGRRVVWVDGPPFRVPASCAGCLGGSYAGVLKTLEYNALVAAACLSPARPNRHLLRCVSTYPTMEAPWVDPADRGFLKDEYACDTEADWVHTSQPGAEALVGAVLAAGAW